ncbi:MAG: protein-L-isoaspartate(D-aspartate) O-methyltransferase [Chloroflexi bacterium]|jgi:protein-L-isoaspartate(D-aspartate) O-methyltransferase|nr:protein-L-isoaspartate(D-aspartate) O-methyltransferase [Chloroflexota bacterium]
MDNELFLESEREYMVETQLLPRRIRDGLVLQVMRTVPRHLFVPPEYRHLAYTDGPLPIGFGQTISQPYIVALMSQLLELKGQERLLEVGTGSGYQAAVLGYLAGEVHTIERFPELARQAEQTLAELGLENVSVHIGDGTAGLLEFAPYQGIIVTAAAPHVPQALLDQLADGGRLVIPVGERGSQFLERWRRRGDDFDVEEVIPVAFVPLVGQFGWRD